MALAWALALAAPVATGRASDTQDLFERRIRPLLIASCYECHSEVAQRQQGGLLLDSRHGWERGGDSGPAVVPGHPEDSLLIRAVRRTDPHLQMPPKNPLTAADVAALEAWVRLGAPDPRLGPGQGPEGASEARNAERVRHWAYQPVQVPQVPGVRNAAWPLGGVDAFVLARLEQHGMHPAPPASPAVLARRLSFDLTGLPPSPDELASFETAMGADPGTAVRERVEHLLASPRFGEHWARHWLDVARFGESLTLRGFVFREAWRYRDYVIDSFNRDVPFDQFLREQIAGDLLTSDSREQRARQVVAATFLALGDTNLEEQDKRQLDMDVVDEQLDTLGKAFLGQAIGCARCHDHKWDPIPTRDYYALAGILGNTRLLKHSNVSEWLETPLPVEPALEESLRRHEASVRALETEIAQAREARSAASGPEVGVVAVDRLPGLVVDNARATAVGDWTRSTHSRHYIGDDYLHDNQEDKGGKTLSFAPAIPRAGRYEVRFAYQPGDSRATNVPVTVFHADGETLVRVNQRERPGIGDRFVSLGEFRFEANGFGYVLVGTEGTLGHVTADAVQFLSVGEAALRPMSAASGGGPAPGVADAPMPDLKAMEARLKQLKASGPRRPMAMGVQESEKPSDFRIHVRGSVHRLGEAVPRGFLTFGRPATPPELPAGQSGRLQLAEWMASPDHPLTARVYVNRVWLWLMGLGLVRSPDNFGTTGDAPSHPELLDHLAGRFVAEGWSTKRLVRSLVLSRTYQQSATHAPGGRGGAAGEGDPDPENRLLSHAHPRRLTAEVLRDALLSVGGRLRLDGGGRTFPESLTADYGHQFGDPVRSVYVPVFRNALPAIFEAFDFPPPGMVTGRRNTSTVVTQALFFMNDPWVRDQAAAAAERVVGSASGDPGRVDFAWRAALGRAPSEPERLAALDHLSSGEASAWTDLMQALFASADFRRLD